ncbi:hypothetical protein ACIRO3_29650 [Streptomyces sp. NPDC102278]|uniref:hypothetical protein n=1 Tax=Streptomyces sp. NPDC102278 TaxID=3366152 RepID=UPI0038071C4A
MADQPLFRPWGVVDPRFWAGAEATEPTAGSPAADFPAEDSLVEDAVAVDNTATVSDDVAGHLAEIQAAAAVDLARANILAEELDATTTAARGEAHIETIRIREVRAYLTLMTGHHESAVAWYLHVVRLHAGLHGPEHPETDLAVRRAYSMWKALPAPDAVRVAGDLIEVFTEVQGAGTRAVPRMREHLQQLRETADPAPRGSAC